ncbi:MAG: hypothetical protein WCJ35_04330 [Planctomycetota bacterium]
MAISICFHGAVRDFFPMADNVILITESTPYAMHVDFVKWFTCGWRGYSRPYAEYIGTVTDFVRPVVNGCFWLNFAIWGEKWGNYLYLNFAVMAAAAALSYYIARQLLGCERWAALLASSLLLLNPASITSYGIPMDIVHTLSALIAVFALVSILQKRMVCGLVLLVVALFTKESTLFAPMAAGLMWLLLRHREAGRFHAAHWVVAAALAAIPIGAWLLARFAVFHGFGQAYVTQDLSLMGIIVSWATFPLLWPLGLSGPTDPSSTIRGVLWRQWDMISLLPIFGLFMSLITVSLVLRALVKFVRDSSWRNENDWLLWLGPWLILAFAQLITLGLPVQNGLFVFVVGIPITCLLLQRAVRTRAVASAMLVVCFQLLLVVPGLSFVFTEHSRAATEARTESRAVTQSLLSALFEAGNKHKRVYVLNDIPIRNARVQAGPFAGTKAEVVLLNNLDGGFPHNSLSVNMVKIGPDRYRITTRVQSPYNLLLVAAQRKELFPSVGEKSVVRNSNITYEFPVAPQPRRGVLGTEHWSIGSELQITLTDDSDFAIVGYDPPTGLYRVVTLPE